MRIGFRYLTTFLGSVALTMVSINCDDVSQDDELGTTEGNLEGCDLNGQCTTPGQFCYSHPSNNPPSDSGVLWCDTSDPLNMHYTTSCAVGNYCEEGLLEECWIGETLLWCNLDLNVLTVSSCGDGHVASTEACDENDGTGPCDGACNADCTAILTGCGDGELCGTEQCDDGDSVSNDGCDANCNLTACGNGVQTVGEGCDDGNGTDSDGCDSNCQPSGCGNGLTAGLEMCDDGNNINGDGCDNDCTTSECGNGIVVFGEQCDDGNNIPGDGCQQNCWLPVCGDTTVDPNEECDEGSANAADFDCTPECLLAECGDGYVHAEEECDEGEQNGFGNDCNADCTLPTCGDGAVDPNEECDDGNNLNSDGCDANCVVEPDCVEETPVPCQFGAYGCLQGTSPSYCMGPGNETLECQCFNPDDFNKGTWLPPGSSCDSACWNGGTLANRETCPGEAYALQIDGPPLELTGTLVGSTDDLDTCGNADPDFDAGEHVFHFTVTQTSSVVLELTDDKGLDSNLVVRRDSCTDAGSEWLCVAFNPDEEDVRREFEVGEYYVIIDSFDGNETIGAYELTVTASTPACGDGVINAGEECDPEVPFPGDGCVDAGLPNECQFSPPINNYDVCEGAQLSIPNGSSTWLASANGFTTSGYLDDYNSESCTFNPSGSGPDRVFRLVPEVSGIMFIRIGYNDAGDVPACFEDPDSPFCWDQLIYVRETCDAQATELDCSDAAFEMGESVSIVVNADEAIYLFVDGYDDTQFSQGPFNLHIDLGF